jgi:predicted Zn-dependent protease
MGEYRHSNALRKAALAAGLVVLAACAGPTSNLPVADPAAIQEESRKQQVIAIRENDQQFARLMKVGLPILEANTDICGSNIAHKAGVQFYSARLNVSNAKRLATVEARGLSRPGEVRVGFTIPGFPAEGVLQPGDIVTRFNGVNAYAAYAGIKRVDRRRPDMQLNILRDGQPMNVTIPTIPVCDIAVVLRVSDVFNAGALNNTIIVNTGTIRALRSDQDLALIFGHELAHITRNHHEAKRTNAAIGALVGAIVSGVIGVDVTDIGERIGYNTFSQEFELEADYVGMYHASRAGWDMTGAASMFRRMAAVHPGSIHVVGGTHPSTVSRAVLVEQTALEIGNKRATNLALVPNYKGQPPSNFPANTPTLAKKARDAVGTPTIVAAAAPTGVSTARQEDAEKQYQRAVEFEEGSGRPQDLEAALKWYRKAAAQGHRDALFNLGMMYVEGRGVRQNNGEAVIYFRQAAELQHPRAHYNMGIMLETGRGVAKSPAKGLTNYIIAANLGAGGEANSARRRLLQSLPRRQIDEAQRRAEEWMKAHQR